MGRYQNRERGIGRRLDYFLVNEEFMKLIKDSSILGDILGSDHCPIRLDVNLNL